MITEVLKNNNDTDLQIEKINEDWDELIVRLDIQNWCTLSLDAVYQERIA